MNVYIIRQVDGENLCVQRTPDGVALEAFGLGISKVDGQVVTPEVIAAALDKKPSADAEDDDGTAYKIERHFVAG